MGKRLLDYAGFKKYLLPGFVFQSVVIGGDTEPGVRRGFFIIYSVPLLTFGIYKKRTNRMERSLMWSYPQIRDKRQDQ